MTSTVLQFLVAGALVVAWIWMLGRPLLTVLARRSRRDSVGYFRHQQAALGRSVATGGSDRSGRLGSLPGAVHPVANWRAQPLERRRLQLLLASAMAAFASLLLAIALRGLFIRLFLLMAIGLVVHLLVAALIGARELRALEARLADGDRAERPRRRTRSRREPDLFADRDPRFDRGFFEPIPEFGPRSDRAEPEPAAAEPATVETPAAETPVGEAVVAETPAGEAPVAETPAGEAPVGEPTFTTPSVERARPPRRSKARPIYIESDLDDGDGTVRAVND